MVDRICFFRKVVPPLFRHTAACPTPKRRRRHRDKAGLRRTFGAAPGRHDLGKRIFCDEKCRGQHSHLDAPGHPLHHGRGRTGADFLEAAEAYSRLHLGPGRCAGRAAMRCLWGANLRAHGYHPGEKRLSHHGLLHSGAFSQLGAAGQTAHALQWAGGGALPGRHWAGVSHGGLYRGPWRPAHAG